MTMFGLPISVFDGGDVEMRAALHAGWRRRDLWWERLQENGNIALVEGHQTQALRSFRWAHWISRLSFAKDDPRRATGYANLALTARLSGSETKARRLYAKAITLWSRVPSVLETCQIKPRARSSLFHLRMEVKHWDTYRDNMKIRLGRFVQETGEALTALSHQQPPAHRLFSRWRGEKPAVFDDTRKLLAASLLVASDEQ